MLKIFYLQFTKLFVELLHFQVIKKAKKYIGETKRNVEVRWKEHSTSNASEPARHVKLNPGHKFSWKILYSAPSHWTKRRVLEAFFINKFKPSVHDQKKIKFLNLFRNGVTWMCNYSFGIWTCIYFLILSLFSYLKM